MASDPNEIGISRASGRIQQETFCSLESVYSTNHRDSDMDRFVSNQKELYCSPQSTSFLPCSTDVVSTDEVSSERNMYVHCNRSQNEIVPFDPSTTKILDIQDLNEVGIHEGPGIEMTAPYFDSPLQDSNVADSSRKTSDSDQNQSIYKGLGMEDPMRNQEECSDHPQSVSSIPTSTSPSLLVASTNESSSERNAPISDNQKVISLIELPVTTKMSYIHDLNREVGDRDELSHERRAPYFDSTALQDSTLADSSGKNRSSGESCNGASELPQHCSDDPMPQSVSGEGSLDASRTSCAERGIISGRGCDKQYDPTTKHLVRSRSSSYHGVSRNRWTGKYEAHLWDGTFQLEGRKRKGKLVYLGGYESEEKAGRAHDLAAIKYWGTNSKTKLNFNISEYQREIEEMKTMTREEYVASLIRRSSCFSRGASMYRGVTRKKDGRWQARIGWVADSKDIYLGTYGTQEEAAEAYDIAAIELRGLNAVTNFDVSNYSDDVKRWLEHQRSTTQGPK